MRIRSRRTSTMVSCRSGFRRPHSRSRAAFRSIPERNLRLASKAETRTKSRLSAEAGPAASRATARRKTPKSSSAPDADSARSHRKPTFTVGFFTSSCELCSMILRCAIAIRIAFCLLAVTPAVSRSQIIPFVPPSPAGEPGSELTVYLLTIGQGDEVWELFGHNAIWIKDRSDGSDMTYNWGMFDVNQPNFLGRFLTGNTSYWMEGIGLESMLQSYTQRNRSLLAQELNLTPEQRLLLKQALETNTLPQNKFYRYDYYRDNCSTRLRDMLDRALGGQLQTAT